MVVYRGESEELWVIAASTPGNVIVMIEEGDREEVSFTLVEVFVLDGEYAENQMNISNFCVKQ